jgi:hypothetical protein
VHCFGVACCASLFTGVTSLFTGVLPGNISFMDGVLGTHPATKNAINATANIEYSIFISKHPQIIHRKYTKYINV